VRTPVVTHFGPSETRQAHEIAGALISMVVRSTTRSTRRPDALRQDRKVESSRNPLATHGRTTHWVRFDCGKVLPRTAALPPTAARLDAR
jgi:hypothetical protein